MTPQEIDRIECAIRHIESSLDVDPWAVEIAVKAMKTQLSAEGTTSDLISRREAIDALWEIRQEEISDGRRFHDYCSLSTAVDVIKDLPSAQPEIVRCKDCKFHGLCRTSPKWAVAPKDDWYCADAERRTDEQTV